MQDLLLKLTPTELLYWAMAILAVGVMLPNPLQGTFKAILDLLKSFVIKKPDSVDTKVDLTIDKLPDLVRELTKLLMSGPESRQLVMQELLKLLGIASMQAQPTDAISTDTITSLLRLLTTEHAKRTDLDFSKELSEIWSKMSGTEMTVPVPPVTNTKVSLPR